MRNLVKCFWFFLTAFLVMGCGGSSEETTNLHNYEAETEFVPDSTVTITVVTTDQFGNHVDGSIVYMGTVLGLGEAELSYDPSEAGVLAFDSNLPGYAPPAMVDLSTANFFDGGRYEATYERDGSVANICPRAINAEGVLIDADVSVNGLAVDFKSGLCQSVSTNVDTTIEGGEVLGIYANPLYIPAGKLSADTNYYYDLMFLSGYESVYVMTTPVDGEIFVDDRSLGWVKDDYLAIRLPTEGEVELSFGEVVGHQTAESVTVVVEDVDNKNNHYWALYGADKNALACFLGMQDGGHPVGGRVFVDDLTELDTGYDFPGCIGLDASLTHTAEFLERDSYQSTDVLSIDAINHVGCEGDFIPGGRLDCAGEYYYVQPVEDRTKFYIRLQFIGPYKGDSEYPIMGRFELNGIQYERQTQDEVLELSEQVTFTLLPVGILEPDQASLTIDSTTLTEQDLAYSPEDNQWIYTVSYVPPVGATEACVTSYNQILMNISSEVGVDFDGVQSLNSSDEDEDCHWLSASGNHVVVAKNWLSGYQTAVNEIHVPEGKIVEQSHFDMLYIPDTTYHQLCISGVTVEAELRLNNYFLGWTNFDEVCVRMDKSVPNTLTIEGVGSRSYTADDSTLEGAYSYITFEDF